MDAGQGGPAGLLAFAQPLAQRDLGRFGDGRWHGVIFADPARLVVAVSSGLPCRSGAAGSNQRGRGAVAGGSGRSPFQVTLGRSQRRWLKALVAQANRRSSGRSPGPGSSCWPRRVDQCGDRPQARDRAQHGRQVAQALLPPKGVDGLRDRKRPGRPRVFPARVVAAVKAIACELPATRGVPLGRWSLPSCAPRSSPPAWSTRLDHDAVALAGRGPDQAVAAPLLDLPPRPRLRGQGRGGAGPVHAASRARGWATDEYVIWPTRRPRIQARCRCHPTLPPGRARVCGWSTSTSAVERWPTWPPGMSTTPPVRPLRAHHRHRPVRAAGHPGHDHRALRLGQAGVLDRRQRQLPPRPGLDRPAGGRWREPAPGPPAGARLLAEPDRDLLLGRATQSACRPTTSPTWTRSSIACWASSAATSRPRCPSTGATPAPTWTGFFAGWTRGQQLPPRHDHHARPPGSRVRPMCGPWRPPAEGTHL